MTVREIQKILNAELYCCPDMLDVELYVACSSDMLSEILLCVKDETVLLSGRDNTQLIRTAEMLDMNCVILVRGKKPGQELIDLASKKDICIMSTECSMFTACGLLYKNGLRGRGEV